MISRSDAIDLCKALGFSNAAKWNRQRMKKKLADLVEMVEDGGINVPEDHEDSERLQEILDRVVEEHGATREGPSEEEQQETQPKPTKPKPTKPAKKTAAKKTTKKTSSAAKKPAKKRSETCFGVAMDLMCKDPEMAFADLQKVLEKKGLWNRVSARTAASSVRMVVSGLRKHGHIS